MAGCGSGLLAATEGNKGIRLTTLQHPLQIGFSDQCVTLRVYGGHHGL